MKTKTPTPHQRPTGAREALTPFSLRAGPLGDLYGACDLAMLEGTPAPHAPYLQGVSALDHLLDRDNQREKDGFPRKIRFGRLARPGRGKGGKVILVPTTVEEKFVHDTRPQDPREERGSGGAGDGAPGDVIGEEPLHGEEGPGAGQAGQGPGGEHEIQSSAYDLGRILTERFQLPNLKEKGKKRSLTRTTYDLTDRNRRFGQILDKKATLRKVVETNLVLGNLCTEEGLDPSRLLISPEDRVYRILSREKDYESQAMVFFVRDYSGSMSGTPTEVVVSQHVMIYSWLTYQYERQVETRFILHDTEAREVSDFHTYYNSSVAGGTRVESALRLVNEIVEQEGLIRDYNIYVFHGTDGDDWEGGRDGAVSELRKILGYCSRVGISIARGTAGDRRPTAVENYLREARLAEAFPKELRVSRVAGEADEKALIEAIRALIS